MVRHALFRSAPAKKGRGQCVGGFKFSPEKSNGCFAGAGLAVFVRGGLCNAGTALAR
jgi:hypothetical protein